MAASSGPSIQIEGRRELARALKKAAGNAGELKQIHATLAVPLVALARMEAPSRSGNLAGSVRASATQRALSLKAGSGHVPYANPIHWGWRARGIDSNPFLIRARDSLAAQVADGYKRHVAELVSKVESESFHG